MLTATLRNVGGSVMMTIPKSLLEGLGLAPNAKVNLSLNEGRLIVERSKPKYSMAELLGQCNTVAPVSADEAAWLELPPQGSEAW